jgi:hypothetical protein
MLIMGCSIKQLNTHLLRIFRSRRLTSRHRNRCINTHRRQISTTRINIILPHRMLRELHTTMILTTKVQRTLLGQIHKANLNILRLPRKVKRHITPLLQMLKVKLRITHLLLELLQDTGDTHLHQVAIKLLVQGGLRHMIKKRVTGHGILRGELCFAECVNDL